MYSNTPQRASARVAQALDQFVFQAGEEALRNRVVPALAGPAHGLRDGLVLAERGELAGGVLRSPVGVEDQGAGAAVLDGRGRRRPARPAYDPPWTSPPPVGSRDR